MARGFLSGAIWGTVISVGGLGAVSVLDMQQDMQKDDLAEAIRALPEDVPAVSVDPEPEAEVAPDTAADEPSEEVAVAEAESESAAVPDAEPAEESGEADATDSEDGAAVMPTDEEGEVAPVAEAASTGAEAPDAEDEPAELPSDGETAQAVVAEVTAEDPSEPAQRPSDVTQVESGGAAPELDAPQSDQDAPLAEAVAAPSAAPETGALVAALDAPATGDAPDVTVPETPAPSGLAAPVDQALSAPERDSAIVVSTEPAQPPAPPVPDDPSALTPVEEAPSAAAPETRDRTATAETAEAPPSNAGNRPQVRRLVTSESENAPDTAEVAAAATRPSIGKPAGSLIDRGNSGSTRLPTLGQAGEESGAPAVDAVVSDQAPLDAFAAAVEVAEGQPRMAILLIDAGTGPMGPDALDSFPFPVTFALDPQQQGAGERMAAYRALGYEVAVLISVPEGAQPSDVEQVLAGSVAAVPEAVALIEAPGSSLQGNRGTTEQATAFATESGHGLVFLPNGLNTAAAIAARENVPSVSVLRDFDGDGQDARTKRRFLDGAAFRARQDGQAVMLGRLTPDTVSALLLWSLQDRASSVAMVPVSSILQDRGE